MLGTPMRSFMSPTRRPIPWYAKPNWCGTEGVSMLWRISVRGEGSPLEIAFHTSWPSRAASSSWSNCPPKIYCTQQTSEFVYMSKHPHTISPAWSRYISWKISWEKFSNDQIIFPLVVTFSHGNVLHQKLKRSVLSPKCQFSLAGQSLIHPFLGAIEAQFRPKKSSIIRLFQPTLGPISALGTKSAIANWTVLTLI